MERNEETKSFYNAIAKQSFKDWFNNPALLPTLSLFINHLPKKPIILDLGCGTGGESRRLSSLGAQVIGIDFSEKSLKFARKNAPECDFIFKDILDMEFQDNYFNGILEAGVLFHFTEKEQDQILKKVFSILKPSGHLLSYYPQGSFEGMQEMYNSGKKMKRYCRLLDVNKWIRQVMRIGFKDYIEHKFNIGNFKCVEFIK